MARVDMESFIEIAMSGNPSFEQCAAKQNEQPSPPRRLRDSEAHESGTRERRKCLFPVRHVE